MEVKRIAVLGSGIMGRGIAQVGAQCGLQVVLYDLEQGILDKAVGTIAANLDKGIARGKVTAQEKEDTLKNLKTTADMRGIAGSEMVFEAVPEDVEIKLASYRRVNEVCGADVLIATNTTSQSITALAAGAARPDMFLGMHFFNPVHIMKLIELVRGMQTSDESVRIATEIGKRMGKELVSVNEYPGFVTSRMNALIGNEAFRMLEEGVASARDIDKAMKLGLNHPMGPFEMIDLVGLDTRLKSMEYLYETLGEQFRPSVLHRKYVQAGRLGKKVGHGVYDYTEE